MKARWKWYIRVVGTEGYDRFVTKLDNETNFAHWDKGEKALSLSCKYAEYVCEGLNMNFHQSYLVKAPSYMEFVNER